MKKATVLTIPVSENGIAFIWELTGRDYLGNPCEALTITYEQACNLRERWERSERTEIIVKAKMIAVWDLQETKVLS